MCLLHVLYNTIKKHATRSGQPRRVRDKPRLLPLTNAITFNTKCLVFSELVNNDSRDVLADFTDVILVSEDTQ